MDFNRWVIGDIYTSTQLTQIIKDNFEKYYIHFKYNFNNFSFRIQEADADTKILSLEHLVGDSLISLETEFLYRFPSVSKRKEMVYLWLKLVLVEGGYELNASIKSVKNHNYLRQKHIDTEGDTEMD